MANTELKGYELSRNFFDWCFENPELISPSHSAIYFFAIEHCNRLGWKSKFGFPTQMVMDAIGIKKHETYIRYLNDLIDWGFLILIQKSTNQYSANIISISNAVPKNGKALEKASLKHWRKQTESIGESTSESKGSILKQENKETEKQINLEQDINVIYLAYPTKCPIRGASNGKSETDKAKIKQLLAKYSKDTLLLVISKYVQECKSKNVYMKNFKTFLNNIPDIDEVEDVSPSKSRMYSYMIPDIGEKIGTEQEYEADRTKYGKDCQFNMYK